MLTQNTPLPLRLKAYTDASHVGIIRAANVGSWFPERNFQTAAMKIGSENEPHVRGMMEAFLEGLAPDESEFGEKLDGLMQNDAAPSVAFSPDGKAAFLLTASNRMFAACLEMKTRVAMAERDARAKRVRLLKKKLFVVDLGQSQDHDRFQSLIISKVGTCVTLKGNPPLSACLCDSPRLL